MCDVSLAGDLDTGVTVTVFSVLQVLAGTSIQKIANKIKVENVFYVSLVREHSKMTSRSEGGASRFFVCVCFPRLGNLLRVSSSVGWDVNR